MIKKKVAAILIAGCIISPVKAEAVEISKDRPESITVEDAYGEKSLSENRKVSFSCDSTITLNEDKIISGSIGDGKNIKRITLYINGDKLGETSVNCNDEVYNFSLNVNYKKAIEKAEAVIETEYKDGTVIRGSQTLETPKMEVKGTVDSLKNGEIITSDKIQVRGWAAGRGGIKNIKIYYNDKLVIDSTANERRSDIDMVYPSYGESNWGYNYYIPRDNSTSIHRIKIIATMADGTSDYWNRTVNTKSLPMRGTVDSPQNSSNVVGRYLEVRGWHLSSSKIKTMSAYINGKYLGDLKVGQARPDVGNAYPDYGNNNAGFSKTFDLSNEGPGQKTLKLYVTNEDGTTDDFTRTINLEKPMTGYLDSVSNGMVIEGNELEIRGWQLSYSKVKNIKAYLDGKYLGDLDVEQSRPDVYKAFPQYENDHAGFSKKFDISNESAGQKTLKLLVTNEDGTTDDFIRKITIKKPDISMPVRGCLDAPQNGNKVSGKYLNIRGWYLSSSQIKSVEVFIDGKSKGQVTPKTSRPDVAKAFPEYNNSNAGFDGEINIESESAGVKTVKVVVTNEDGNTDDFVRKITIEKPDISMPARGCLDTPKNGSNVSGMYLNIRGWYLSSSQIKSVEVFIDGRSKGQVTSKTPRPDVAKAFPAYNNSNAGFDGKINILNESSGKKTLKVVVTNEDGTKEDFVRTINITRPDNISHIDTPTIDYDYYNDSIKIKGWALSGYGVKNIHVYLDNKLYKEVPVNISRPDVAKAYPDYCDSTSGFSIEIPMSGLATGQHQVRLYVRTGDGKTFLPTILSSKDEHKFQKNSISFYNNNLNVSTRTYYTAGGWRKMVLDHAFGMRGVPYYLGGDWNNATYVTFSKGSYHFTPASQLPETGAVPGYGLDCAGFTQRCYERAGIYLGDTTWTQVNRLKRTYMPQPGDLYFKNNLEHVGIFLKNNGDGTFTYIDCNQTWEGELPENHVRGRVEVRREKKMSECVFYTPY